MEFMHEIPGKKQDGLDMGWSTSKWSAGYRAGAACWQLGYFNSKEEILEGI